jgi:hypothetical protein
MACERCGTDHCADTEAWPPQRVGRCARCGEDHDAIAFVPFKRPPLQDHPREDPYATHWASCPTTGEPIFSICAPKDAPRATASEVSGG